MKFSIMALLGLSTSISIGSQFNYDGCLKTAKDKKKTYNYDNDCIALMKRGLSCSMI